MGVGSVTTVGAAMEANDSPTNCAVLDEGASADGGGTGAARSDIQYLIRLTELSMLLDDTSTISESLTGAPRIKLT